MTAAGDRSTATGDRLDATGRERSNPTATADRSGATTDGNRSGTVVTGDRSDATVAVVGAGISGLAVRHYLSERGVDSVVYEAADEPGGAIDTRRVDGRIVERGPQRTRRTPGVAELVAAAGLEERVVEAPDLPLYVYHDGNLRRAPLSPRAALRTDLLSTRGKLRVLLEPLTAPPHDDESVREYLVRAFGREFADRFAGPLYAGLYAADPDAMPARHSIAKALDAHGVDRSVLLRAARAALSDRERPPAVSFEDGLQVLPRALAGRHDGVHLGTPVQAIRRAGGATYVVETDRGAREVDRVVLTTPATTTADLVEGVDPASADALRTLTYNPLAVVALASDADLTAVGYKTSRDCSLRTRGVTCNDALFDREGVYTCYLGGGPDPEVLGWDDDRLGAVAAREFETVTGAEAEPIAVYRVRPGMPAYDDSWSALDRIDPPAGVDLCANYRARAGIPGRIREARALADRIAGRGATTARTRSGSPSRGRTTNGRT